MTDRQPGLEPILRRAPVVPVVILDEARHAVALARALVAGGLPAIEVTLRTAAGLDSIRAIAAEVEGAIVGAGTVLDAGNYRRAVEAGAAFIVSPGATGRLTEAAADHPVPFLPAVATASEAMRLAEQGYRFLKFFPAEPAGGAAYLSALASPLPHLRFCPTGGISLASAPVYLRLANVVCVGGSWMVPKDRIAAEDWAFVESGARAAASLR